MAAFVHQEAGTVFGSEKGLDPKKPLMEQGFDSLMAIEFQQALSRGLDLALTVSLLFNHPTLEQIATYLVDQLPDPSKKEPETGVPETESEEWKFLDAMSPEELEAYVQAELANE